MWSHNRLAVGKGNGKRISSLPKGVGKKAIPFPQCGKGNWNKSLPFPQKMCHFPLFYRWKIIFFFMWKGKLRKISFLPSCGKGNWKKFLPFPHVGREGRWDLISLPTSQRPPCRINTLICSLHIFFDA